jgi:hypothetical protein
VPRVCVFYPGICVTTEAKSRKNLNQGKKNLTEVKKKPHSGQEKALNQGRKMLEQTSEVLHIKEQILCKHMSRNEWLFVLIQRLYSTTNILIM